MQHGKIKDRILELSNIIRRYNEYYYEKNKSLVTDKAYDILFKELTDLENEYPEFKLSDSPTTNIGHKTSSTFNKVKHKYKMLSLDNTYDMNDLDKFTKRVKKYLNKESYTHSNYLIEYKYDGMSISLEYEDSVLVRALTRGDGEIGEDVTENILKVKSIPKKLPIKGLNIVVRGELVMPLSIFSSLNKERIKRGDEPWQNARNITSGTVKSLDTELMVSRGITGYFYYIYGDINIATQSEVLDYLEKLGFPIGLHELCFNLQEILTTIDEFDDFRQNLDVDTDGVVIKVNDLNTWEEIGYTARAPRFAVAYKYSTVKAETKVVSIDWQVGRTGKITPVANLKPVFISGSTVSRASLHNYNNIESLDLKIGDTVIIEKAAEIIPNILSVNLKKRKNAQDIIKPSICPECGEKLRDFADKVDSFCINPYCNGKLLYSILHLVGKDGLNIEGFGIVLAKELVDNQTIIKLSDIYKLPKIFSLSEFLIEKKVGKQIEESKKNNPLKLLIGLGIPSIGNSKAKIILKEFQSIEKLLSANELAIIEALGESSGNNVIKWRNLDSTRELINDLKEYGVNLNDDNIILNDDFKGKTFVLTGSINKIWKNKDNIKKLIEERNGKIVSSISSKTSYLIVGDNPGGKLEQAKKYNIELLTEEEFSKLL